MLSWLYDLGYQGIYLVTLLKTIELEKERCPDVHPLYALCVGKCYPLLGKPSLWGDGHKWGRNSHQLSPPCL